MPATQPLTSAATPELEKRVMDVGRLLASRINRVVDAVPGKPQGPVPLARGLGVNKVLTSRLLRAATAQNPVETLQLMPGPDPLRQLAKAAGKKGVPMQLVRELEAAAEAFDQLIREEAGARSGFDTILAAWLPSAREEFELRRKQAAFRAISELRGQSADVHLSTVLLHPSKTDPSMLDVVWLNSLLALQRLRPGAAVRFTSRRVPGADDSLLAGEDDERAPQTLDGEPITGPEGLRLDAFSSSPPPMLEVHRAGQAVHYTLGAAGFGPRSAVDLTLVEVNRAELARDVPASMAGRKRHFFPEVNVPAKKLVFDVLIHDAAASGEPMLAIYDTAFEGAANVNDPARDIDLLDLAETITPLHRDFTCREVAWHGDLLAHVFAKLGWDAAAFNGYRTAIDYPLYGSQVTMAFPAPVRSDTA